jgi:hypothetical protein
VGEDYTTSTAASQVPSAGITHTRNDNNDDNNNNDNNATVAQQHARIAHPHAWPERTNIHAQPSMNYNQHAALKTTTSRRRQRVGAQMQTRPAGYCTRVDRTESVDHASIHQPTNQPDPKSQMQTNPDQPTLQIAAIRRRTTTHSSAPP